VNLFTVLSMLAPSPFRGVGPRAIRAATLLGACETFLPTSIRTSIGISSSSLGAIAGDLLAASGLFVDIAMQAHHGLNHRSGWRAPVSSLGSATNLQKCRQAR
jgi:hypothetical protein